MEIFELAAELGKKLGEDARIKRLNAAREAYENEDKIIVRPSGTEPKIKIYILAHDTDKDSLAKKAELYSIDSRKMTEV